jgi:DNA-binding Lrp family transcriptional regulator
LSTQRDFAGLQFGRRTVGRAHRFRSKRRALAFDFAYDLLENCDLRKSCIKEMGVIPFFVQIKCHLGKSYSVANALADAEIASEIYSTAGDFDLLVKFYVEQGTDIGHFVNEKVQTIPGIHDTRTIITFKAF